MINDINLENILNIYEKEISKNVKNKRKLRDFEDNKMQHISNIITLLKNNEIGHRQYNIFLIKEPKIRLVMSLSVKDKIINHFITRYILEKKLTKYLDMRNVATRIGMGTDYALKLTKKYLELNKKYEKVYVLKIDISKYFYSINHYILKNMLKNKLDDFEYNLIEQIIESTNKEYINEVIKKIINKYKIDIPLYESNKGLPIGNMTSQFLSIFYLNKLDHYIIHTLGFKHYIRYMDDFIIISPEKEKLKEAKYIIKKKLENDYDLKINLKKTHIYEMKYGFSFLGYIFKFNKNKKTIIKIKKSNLEKVKKRVKQVKNLLNKNKISYKKAFCSIMTYSNCYKYGNNKKVLNIIDRWFYE